MKSKTTPFVPVLFVVVASIPDSTITHTPDVVASNRLHLAQLVASDPQYGGQKAALASIGLEQAWDVTTGSKDVIVAVIDDAIDIRHPDLQANLIPGKDFVDNDNDPSPNTNAGCEKESHGTLMAGIIGAVGANAIGIAGVNWNVKILPLRVGCVYNENYERQAIEYAISRGAHIINSSYGGPVKSRFENEIVTLLKNSPNVLWVTAAGNHHGNNDDAPMYPAKVDVPNRISVAASDATNGLTEWSQWGATSVDVAAPGVTVSSTAYSAAGYDRNGTYEVATGTSPATAVVSGIAALLKAKDLQDGQSNLNGQDLKAAIIGSVSPLKNGSARLVSDGVAHARKALDFLDRAGPVVVVKNVSWDDGTGGNKLIDANESANLRVTIENIGAAATNVQINLSTAAAELGFQSAATTLPSMFRGNLHTLVFPISSGAITAWKRFEITVNVTADSQVGNYITQRKFALQTGPLSANGEWVNGIIQRDVFDELQYYHARVPAGVNAIAFEVEYTPGDSRDIGLAAKIQNRPTMYFGNYTGLRYWLDTTYTMDARAGIERVTLPVDALNSVGQTVHALVFNTPDEDISLPYGANRAYRIRACGLMAQDTNSPPTVSAGQSQAVEPNAVVRLSGSVIDVEAQPVTYWWEAPSSIELSNPRELNPSFVAPITGDFTFRLHATDSGCRYSSASVTIHVQDEFNSIQGLLLTPPRYEVYESASLQFLVQGAVDGQRISKLDFISGPSGLVFDGTSQTLSWSSATPIGEYAVLFSAQRPGSNDRVSGSLIVVVKSQSSAVAKGGGCTIGLVGGFDPTLPALTFVSFAVLFARRKRKNNF